MRFRPVLSLILISTAVALTADDALPNPFGVFNLSPFNRRPAQEQVDLAMQSGYAGLMASTSVPQALDRLREFTTVPAVRNGTFRIYAILWQVRIDQPLKEDFLSELVTICQSLDAALWCTVVGQPGERDLTVAYLAKVADACRAGGAQLVLYPHHACTFETTEEAIEIRDQLQRPEVQLSLHLCHEYKARNLDRIDEIVAKALPHLALVSINGIDTSAPILGRGWDGIIIPLNEGDFDLRPFLTLLVRQGYRGPILLHNYGFKADPEAYLPASMARWQTLSAEVARGLEP